MALDEIAGSAEGSVSERTRWISVFIGVLAVLLAICAVGGDNSTKNALKANIDASNLWAFFQAKNMRRTAIELAADELELRLAADATLAAESRAAITKKAEEYRARAKKLTSDIETQEGLDELFTRAKAMEAVRDAAMQQDPFFDWAQAMLQIAIVLASVSIVANNAPLVWLAGALGALGTLLMLNGFTMVVTKLPLLG